MVDVLKNKMIIGLVAGAFIVGFVLGHYTGEDVFGYGSYEECVAKEYRGGSPWIAARYCRTLFPAA